MKTNPTIRRDMKNSCHFLIEPYKSFMADVIDDVDELERTGKPNINIVSNINDPSVLKVVMSIVNIIASLEALDEKVSDMQKMIDFYNMHEYYEKKHGL